MGAQGTNPPCVFIVDDEPSARETLEALLLREGYRLAFANSGQQALERLNELSPDAILLDVMMPGMDGFDVCRRLKAGERWRHIPVILVTALDTKDDIVRGLDAGADEFLSKPVSGPELRARVRSMLRTKKQFDELEAAMRLRESLSHMIVHDMRNPLTTILMTIFAVRGSVVEPRALEYLDVVEGETRRLEAFMTDLLLMTKMQENRLILKRSPVDLVQMIQTVGEAHRAIAQSRGVSLVTELPPYEFRRVSLDADLFRRVLDNLLSNALKFAPRGSTITLRLEYPQVDAPARRPFARVRVLDEGPGIPAEHRERVFDKFEIVQLKEREVPQVGLGLAFCKLAVEAHGGRIFVEANEPQGSIFTVEIQVR
jgi:two-component system sensor histidine kinase/response regulator